MSKVEITEESLNALRLPELQAKYVEIVGEPTRVSNKGWLIRKILEAPKARATTAEKNPASSKMSTSRKETSIAALQARHQELIGRPTGSTDVAYLRWRLRQAECGLIRVGSEPRAAHGADDILVLPLRMPAPIVEQMDEARRRLGLRSRAELFRRALHGYFVESGERDGALGAGSFTFTTWFRCPSLARTTSWTRSPTCALCVPTATRCFIGSDRRSPSRRFVVLSGSARRGQRTQGKELGDAIGTRAGSTQHVGFPETHDDPAFGLEGAVVLAITRHVPLHLRDPVAGVVALGELRKPPSEVASVPEVAVAEDHEAMPGEHDVRATRQPRDVEPVAKPAAPQLTPQGKLAPRVRLRAGAPRGRGRALGGRAQPGERGRGARALARLHRGHILPAAGGDRPAVNRPPLGRADLLTALCRSLPAGPSREHDRAPESPSPLASAFSGSRVAIAPAMSPTRRTPRTLALS